MIILFLLLYTLIPFDIFCAEYPQQMSLRTCDSSSSDSTEQEATGWIDSTSTTPVSSPRRILTTEFRAQPYRPQTCIFEPEHKKQKQLPKPASCTSSLNDFDNVTTVASPTEREKLWNTVHEKFPTIFPGIEHRFPDPSIITRRPTLVTKESIPGLSQESFYFFIPLTLAFLASRNTGPTALNVHENIQQMFQNRRSDMNERIPSFMQEFVYTAYALNDDITKTAGNAHVANEYDMLTTWREKNAFTATSNVVNDLQSWIQRWQGN